MIITEELLTSEIEDGHKGLQLLFENVKGVQDIQKVHSMKVLDLNKIACKIYSLSTQKTVVVFFIYSHLLLFFLIW